MFGADSLADREEKAFWAEPKRQRPGRWSVMESGKRNGRD